ncbi:hypothetical protein [Shimia sp. R9_3]|uniref:hypothetical protein n=1 Tax=Shimia sp. R9_3 TaxID=2821113 RepID=UPI001ADC21DC|nr:hypothetical protein [Shimia sp. R9_3]MBO9399320.1 hypothetical protein [Shimia sp. R9_3]
MDEAFKDFLKDISVSFLQGNLPLWRSRLILPLTITTKTEHTILRTEEEVAENFGMYLKVRDALCVEVADRIPVMLEHSPDGTWVGTFQTRLLRNEALIEEPYTSTAIMQIVEDRFRMTTYVNARGHYQWTERADA